MKPKHLVLIAVGLVLVASVLIVSNCSRVGEVVQSGDTLSITLSHASADTDATFKIALVEGTDAAHESAHIFEAIEHPAIAKAVLNVTSLDLTVSYDSSAISETEIATLLAEAGYSPR